MINKLRKVDFAENVFVILFLNIRQGGKNMLVLK
jgi:hypothetical protein